MLRNVVESWNIEGWRGVGFEVLGWGYSGNLGLRDGRWSRGDMRIRVKGLW